MLAIVRGAEALPMDDFITRNRRDTLAGGQILRFGNLAGEFTGIHQSRLVQTEGSL